jgi:hypothetical protein
MTRSCGATGTEANREPANLTPELTDQVFEILDERFMPFAELAHRLNAIPWEVARACRALRAQGRAEEDSEPRFGYCRRANQLTAPIFPVAIPVDLGYNVAQGDKR